MKRFTVFISLFSLTLIPYIAFGKSEHKEQNYYRMVNLMKPIKIMTLREARETHLAGVDLTVYGYNKIMQYGIASQTFTLFVLGMTNADELLLGAVDLSTHTFSLIARFDAQETKQVLNKDLGFALCFLDHHFSHERLRYVFLTYTVVEHFESHKKIYMKVFRLENDETFTYTQIVFEQIGRMDVFSSITSDIPDTSMKISPSSGVISSEPDIRILPRILLADVNHDEFMDIVLWKRVYIAKRHDAKRAANKDNGLRGFTLDHEEIQVMFFDWETVTFSEPMTMPTTSLTKEHLWRLLFPSAWFQYFDDWKE